MDNEQFERPFQSALQERGPAYIEARKEIVASARSAARALQAKQASADWRVVLQARILTGWIANAALFQQCVDYTEGKLPGRPGITGKFSPVERAREIAALGPAVTPCLLELLLKIRPLDGEQRAGIFGAVKQIGDKESVLPLISLLSDENIDYRRGAAGALGGLGDPRSVPSLLSVLRDPAQPETVRASAAGSLGALNAAEASPILQELLRTDAVGLDLRKASVRALAALKDTTSTPALVQAASSTSDIPYLILLIETLGSIGDRTAVPMLEKLEKHPDEFVQEAAKESREKAGTR